MKTTDVSAVLAGAIKTRCRVTSEGHALCTIPLAVPPGTNKLEPRLSLVYASDHQNGLLGLGWRLTGLSTITRVGQTMAQDGNWTAVDYSDRDRFSLDGQRLVPTPPTPSLEQPAYHTERETWSKVVAIEEPGIAGPAGFRVTTKKGTVLEYGLDPDATSRVLAVGRNVVRVWALSRVLDLFGNYMTITYSQDAANGSYAPQKIEYTGHVNPNAPPHRSVVFEYEPRTDEMVRYQGGSVIRETRRLHTLTTFIDSQPVNCYTFAYQYGARSRYSQLSSLTLSDGDGETRLPPTTFDWAREDEPLFLDLKTLQVPAEIPTSSGEWFVMDVTGNGLTDLVRVWSHNGLLRYAILFSDREGFGQVFVSEPTALPYFGDVPGLFTADVNGDGRLDLVYVWVDINTNDLYYATMISDGHQFQVSPTRPFTGYNPGILPAFIPMQVAGNGRTDIVYPFVDSNGFLNLQVMLSDGAEYVAQQQPQQTSYQATDSDKLMPATITGSPRQDLAYAYYSVSDSAMKLVSLVSDGSRFTPAEVESLPLSSNQYSRLLPLNLNGDNLTDVALVCQPDDGSGLVAYIFVSDGTRIRLPEFTTLPLTLPNAVGTLTPMDITGDGRLDLLYASLNDGGVTLTPLLCQNGILAVQDGVPNDFTWHDRALYAESLNGKCKAGILYADRGSSPATDSSGWTLGWFEAGPGYPGLMFAIHNGIGGTTTFKYDSLASPCVYTDAEVTSTQRSALSQLIARSGLSISFGRPDDTGSPFCGSPPSRKFVTVPAYVVVSLERTDGRGHSYSTTYQYADARIDLEGRGWLGFAARTQTDPDDNLLMLKQYHQEFPLTSMPDTTTCFRLSDQSLLTKQCPGYTVLQGPPGVYQVRQGESVFEHYSYASPNSTTPDYTRTNIGSEQELVALSKNLADPAYSLGFLE
jgi:hypothetical protein